MKRVLGLGLALVVLAAACGGGTAVDEIGAGDCFDDPDTEVVSALELIDCAEPHDNEVFAEIFMSESAFPGDNAIGDFAFDGCLAPFEAYVGESYEESPLDYFYLGPTEDSWDLGDRGVLCVLYSVDLSKLTGSSRS
ncbi:MAG: septum formation family protein [Acidimicrobiales bacterium]